MSWSRGDLFMVFCAFVTPTLQHYVSRHDVFSAIANGRDNMRTLLFFRALPPRSNLI
jgi:hypothetical protein